MSPSPSTTNKVELSLEEVSRVGWERLLSEMKQEFKMLKLTLAEVSAVKVSVNEISFSELFGKGKI